MGSVIIRLKLFLLNLLKPLSLPKITLFSLLVLVLSIVSFFVVLIPYSYPETTNKPFDDFTIGIASISLLFGISSLIVLTFSLILLFIKKHAQSHTNQNEIKNSTPGFIAGLIFGALFSLIVNVITVQITDTIQKQRILEAVENEILFNVLQAGKTIDDNTTEIKIKEPPNYFHSLNGYSRDLWEQSSDPLKYISQLDPTIQKEIMGFYVDTLKRSNKSVSKLDNISAENVYSCYFPPKKQSKEEKEFCLAWYKDVLTTEIVIAEDVQTNGNKVLDIFHPTEDRLNNIFLRLLIGGKSIRT